VCNCGNKTRQNASIGTSATPSAMLTSPLVRKPAVDFEYTGPTAMTVRGPFSGSRYRFHYPGARVRVHEQDANSLAAIPHLRLISPSKV